MKKGTDVKFEAYIRWLKRVGKDELTYQTIGNATTAAFRAGWRAAKRHTNRKRLHLPDTWEAKK